MEFFSIYVSRHGRKEKIFSSLLRRNYRILPSSSTDSEDASSEHDSGDGPVAARTPHSTISSISRAGNFRGPAVDGSPRRAGGTEHLHFSRSICTVEKARAALVARQGFERDDLARAQGVFRARALSRLACRHRQEISGDVCLPRLLREGMGA